MARRSAKKSSASWDDTVPMLCTIIVAAGSSRRMGFDKLFAPLHGKPVVLHTIDAFERADCVDEIVVVGHPERLAELERLVRSSGSKKVRHVVAGGRHRQDSVRAGLNVLAPSVRYVAVHDAARPLVTPAQILRVLQLAQAHGAASLAEPITDTLKRADENHFVRGGIDRDGLYAMQTPQIFSRDLLVDAYAAVTGKKISVTDEVSAVEHLGRKVVLVPNDEFNLKITFPRDLQLAELFLSQQARS